MKRMIIATSCAYLLVAGVAAAQSGSTEKMDHKKMDKAMMVTGCVEAGPEAGHYMLSNGMMAGDTMGKNYMLMGGDLKAHVGHKVEVTGMRDDSKMMGKDKMATDKMATDKTPSANMSMGLKVKSVKMLSATCP
jgi:hypothetical protein